VRDECLRLDIYRHILGSDYRLHHLLFLESSGEEEMTTLTDQKAFTLIELMIVVAILSILTGIAIPKYKNFVRKAREGATKGNLGAIRSALTIYYSDTDGLFPSRVAGAFTGLEVMPFVGMNPSEYLDAIPLCTEDCQNYSSHRVNGYAVEGVNGMGKTGSEVGGWAYFCPFNITEATSVCRVSVNCGDLDSRGEYISYW
jgi:prepilin-type N-terminal cleavage/methylation domain-containing protein